MLNHSDFEATCITMKTLDESFAYFNSGHKAGASQPHKHIQVIPLTHVPGQRIPIDERVIDAMMRAEHSYQGQQSGSKLPTNSNEENYNLLGNMQNYNTNAYSFLDV